MITVPIEDYKEALQEIKRLKKEVDETRQLCELPPKYSEKDNPEPVEEK